MCEYMCSLGSWHRVLGRGLAGSDLETLGEVQLLRVLTGSVSERHLLSPDLLEVLQRLRHSQKLLALCILTGKQAAVELLQNFASVS